MSQAARRIAFLAALLLAPATGCGLTAPIHQADAAYRRAITAHLAGDLESAEAGYLRVIQLGHPTAATWNNLGAIHAARGDYRAARRLVSRAVALDGTNLVALTNYGVLSYHLYDFNEAERSLRRAQAVRTRTMQSIPSLGRMDWDSLRYRHYTEPLAARVETYLRRLAATPHRIADKPTLLALL